VFITQGELREVNILSSNQFEKLFKESFEKFFDGLHRYAFTLLRDNDKANDAVQSIFTRWWETKTHLDHSDAAKAYLYTAVYRHCLNVIRHEKIKLVHKESYTQQLTTSSNGFSEMNSYEELDHQIQSAIDSLPPQCQLIFRKSRFEEKRYGEIAEEMNLSIKTIEAQMGKALKILREKLSDYL
jgi:RNA polymerase sigma-70 factor, ECF subfamily